MLVPRGDIVTLHASFEEFDLSQFITGTQKLFTCEMRFQRAKVSPKFADPYDVGIKEIGGERISDTAVLFQNLRDVSLQHLDEVITIRRCDSYITGYNDVG
jgi:hypothetical protein